MGFLRVINSSGDSPTEFSPKDHVVAAEVFADMVKQGFVAFETATPGADPKMLRTKKELVFNPEADEILMTRQPQGG